MQWVTLHISLVTGEKRIMGLLDPSKVGGYVLTKLVTVEEGPSEDGRWGTWTKVHEGTWILNQGAVWMVEYEPESPVAGFQESTV